MNNIYTTKFKRTMVPIISAAALLSAMAAIPAYAQTSSSSYVTATIASSSAGKADRLAKIISRSDSEIASRISDLDKLNARIGSMVNVSSNEKAAISNEVQSNTAGLTALQAKIGSDTDASTALADERAIFGSFRIYALVIPQGYIEASTDRVGIIVGMMKAIESKIQSRMAADQSAGKDTSSLASYMSDLDLKTSDATQQAQNANTGVASLVPDLGDQTLFASNTAAIKSSRAMIKTASDDLRSARADIQNAVLGLKALK